MILPPNGITTTYSPGSVATSDASRPASATEAYSANGTTSVDTVGRKTDRVELSDRGRMMGLAAKFLGQLDAAEDVRPEKIEEARDVRRVVAESVRGGVPHILQVGNEVVPQNVQGQALSL